MATGGGSAELTLSVRFAQKHLALFVKHGDTVNYVVKKAAAALKEENEGLVLLFRGTPLHGEAIIGDAVGRSTVSVLHLQKNSNVSERARPQTAWTGPTKQQLEPLNGFCRGECGDLLCSIEPVFKCNNCRLAGCFTRYQEDPIDFHADDISVKQLMGKCSSCQKENVTASVTYQCKVCKTSNVPFLRQVRQNIHKKPCMKCGDIQTTIFLFGCSSRHSMCLECFSNMCKILLDSGHFRHFPMMGYSICCPGPGSDCQDTPVADPHHFYLIDGAKEYYRLFKDKSVDAYRPSGDNILCSCKTEIDLSSGTEVDVTPPQPQPETQTNVGGGMWFLKRLFQRAPPPPKPVERKTRRRASCSQCQKCYCVECKQFWHDGECQCIVQDEDISQHYQIDRAKADASRWPQQ